MDMINNSNYSIKWQYHLHNFEYIMTTQVFHTGITIYNNGVRSWLTTEISFYWDLISGWKIAGKRGPWNFAKSLTTSTDYCIIFRISCHASLDYYQHECRADSRFVTSQWETALLCNDVSHWLGANLALWLVWKCPEAFSLHHDDDITWKCFPHNWPFVRGIHWSPVDSPHKGPVIWALIFSLVFSWLNC